MWVEPIFRRDEIELAVEAAINEVLGPDPANEGDDIVPQKLAKLFPDCSKRRAVRM
jgi:hypothetical protein